MKASKLAAAARALPEMNRAELLSVPRLPGEMSPEFAALPRAPEGRDDPYLAGAGEVDQLERMS